LQFSSERNTAVIYTPTIQTATNFSVQILQLNVDQTSDAFDDVGHVLELPPLSLGLQDVIITFCVVILPRLPDPCSTAAPGQQIYTVIHY